MNTASKFGRLGVTNNKNNKLWTKNYILSIVIYFFLQISQQITMVVIPLYTQFLGGSKTTAGLIMTVFTISALLTRPVVGYLCDVKGRRFILICGLIAVTLTTAGYNLAVSIILLAVLRFLHGAGFSAVGASSSTIVSDVIPGSRIMEGLGYYGLSITLAGAIGPALALNLVSDNTYNPAFVFASIVVLLSIGCALFLSKNTQQNSVTDNTNSTKPDPIKLKDLIPVLRPPAVMFFITVAHICIVTFIPTYAISVGFENSGKFYTLQALAMMISRPIMGKLSDRLGVDRIFFPSVIVYLLVFIALGTSQNSLVFLICGALNGLSIGSLQPIMQGLTIKLSPENARGTANAAFFCAVDLGYGIGATLWGAIADLSGFKLVFFLCAAIVGISIVLYFVILRKHVKNM